LDLPKLHNPCQKIMNINIPVVTQEEEPTMALPFHCHHVFPASGPFMNPTVTQNEQPSAMLASQQHNVAKTNQATKKPAFVQKDLWGNRVTKSLKPIKVKSFQKKNGNSVSSHKRFIKNNCSSTKKKNFLNAHPSFFARLDPDYEKMLRSAILEETIELARGTK
jgi:hypothetical protein